MNSLCYPLLLLLLDSIKWLKGLFYRRIKLAKYVGLYVCDHTFNKLFLNKSILVLLDNLIAFLSDFELSLWTKSASSNNLFRTYQNEPNKPFRFYVITEKAKRLILGNTLVYVGTGFFNSKKMKNSGKESFRNSPFQDWPVSQWSPM